MKYLILNSGGKDVKLAAEWVMANNPTGEFLSFTIETASQEDMANAETLANQLELNHFVLPFMQTFTHISGTKNPHGAAQMWSFEMHFKGLQYALKNGYDYVVSGHLDNTVTGDIVELLDLAQRMLVMSKTVTILRPIAKADINRRNEMAQEIAIKRGKKG